MIYMEICYCEVRLAMSHFTYHEINMVWSYGKMKDIAVLCFMQ